MAFIFFLEEEFAETQAEFFDSQIPLDPPRMANGNLTGFFGDHENDRVGFLAQAQPGAVAQAEIAALFPAVDGIAVRLQETAKGLR